MPTGNNSSSLHSLSSNGSLPQPSLGGVEGCDQFQHTIIHVTPADDSTATHNPTPKVEVSRKRSAKITRASVLRRECTSLPSLLPYAHRHRLPSPLRRSLCVSNQRLRSCSAQPDVAPLHTKAHVQSKTPLLELSPSMSDDTISVASSSSSLSSLLNDTNQESFILAPRPPSRDGIAYEIIFSSPSVHCRFTPHPQFGPDYTYSFSRDVDLEGDDDDWNTDGEFEDSDLEEDEDIAPSTSQCNCKRGVFFTAAKPPLPPSAMERIRRYGQCKYI